MSYTGTEIFNMAVAVIDELSDTGAIVDSQIAEYKYRAPYLLDMWQHEMAKTGDLYKTLEVSCYRKNNLLTDVAQFQMVENTGTDQDYTAKGVNCFYFEVDGDCTVTFPGLTGTYVFNGGEETAFNETITITVPAGTTSFLSCRGIFDSESDVTMTFGGNYYFRHNNRALSPYKFASADKVPDFKPWYKVQMPSDFKSRTQIIDEYPSWQYSEANNHRWEGNNELYVLFSYEGLIRIKYVPIPAKITALTQTLEVDEITATSGAYYLATHFAMADQNDSLAQLCRDKFRELKIDSMVRQPLSPSEIKDVYGI